MTTQDMVAHEDRLRDLDAQGLRELYVACGEYHQKDSSGPGAAAICVCGHACGGSAACRGLGVLRDLFRYADFDNEQWRQQFDFVARNMDR